MELEEFGRLIATVPPRCLQRFRVEPAEPPPGWTGWAVAWKLSCRCGCGEGAVLGYPLGDLKPGFEGHPYFVSPLAIRCTACTAETEILDTAADGEGAEVERRESLGIGCAAVRGEGPRVVYRCPGCGASRAEIVVSLNYNRQAPDYLSEEPMIGVPPADVFNWFRMDVRCAICKRQAEVTTIDTKA